MFSGERDNERSMPNLDFVIKGLEAPLKLHTSILCCASDYVSNALSRGEAAAAAQAVPAPRARIEWPFDTTNEERDALVDVLRFCYGRPLQVEPRKVCPLIAAVWRLQLREAKNVSDQLVDYALGVARSNVPAGAAMLRDCVKYEECCDNRCELDRKLAGIVLTEYNMTNYYRDVVTMCLMKLPARMLDMVTYSCLNSRINDFSTRMMYVRVHRSTMSTEERRKIVDKALGRQLTGEDIEKLRQSGLYTDSELLKRAIVAMSTTNNIEPNRNGTCSQQNGTCSQQ